MKKSDTVEKSTFAAILIKSESVGFLDFNKNTHKKINISDDKYEDVGESINLLYEGYADISNRK